MIKLPVNSNETYVKKAENLFYPVSMKINNFKLKNLQTLIELIKEIIKEIIIFIPKTIQRKFFIKDFNNRINLISTHKKNYNHCEQSLNSYVKKRNQLNNLHSVYLLIKKYHGYNSESQTELTIRKLINENQKAINTYINKSENKKTKERYLNSSNNSNRINAVAMKSLQSEQEEIRNTNESPILINKEDIVKTDCLIKSDKNQKKALPPHLHETDNSVNPIEIHESVKTPTQPSILIHDNENIIKHETDNSTNPVEIHESVKISTQPPRPLTSNSESLGGRVKKLSGLKDLEIGVKNIRNGNYGTGLCKIVSGSLRMIGVATIMYVAKQVIGNYQNSNANFDNPVNLNLPTDLNLPTYLPVDLNLNSNTIKYNIETGFPEVRQSPEITESQIPEVTKSQIRSEFFNPKKRSGVTIITAYDEGIKDYAELVIPNQKAFTAKNGYDYIEYYGNLADPERAPYWSKIVALYDQLKKTKKGEWLVWLDASVLVTNTKKNFNQIIKIYGKDSEIILTTDPQVPINNAVFLIKNTPWTKNWIQKVWERSDLAKGGKGNCWSWGEPFCHYEQQAMTELWQNDLEVRSHTNVIPNKEMNAFYRYSHFDPYRRMIQDYDEDPENSKWTPGDFICKVTGMDRDRRFKIIKHVKENCVDQDCELIEF